METPLLVLGVIWLLLLGAEFIWNAESLWMEVAVWTIWAVFSLDIVVGDD